MIKYGLVKQVGPYGDKHAKQSYQADNKYTIRPFVQYDRPPPPGPSRYVTRTVDIKDSEYQNLYRHKDKLQEKMENSVQNQINVLFGNNFGVNTSTNTESGPTVGGPRPPPSDPNYYDDDFMSPLPPSYKSESLPSYTTGLPSGTNSSFPGVETVPSPTNSNPFSDRHEITPNERDLIRHEEQLLSPISIPSNQGMDLYETTMPKIDENSPVTEYQTASAKTEGSDSTPGYLKFFTPVSQKLSSGFDDLKNRFELIFKTPHVPKGSPDTGNSSDGIYERFNNLSKKSPDFPSVPFLPSPNLKSNIFFEEAKMFWERLFNPILESNQVHDLLKIIHENVPKEYQKDLWIKIKDHGKHVLKLDIDSGTIIDGSKLGERNLQIIKDKKVYTQASALLDNVSKEASHYSSSGNPMDVDNDHEIDPVFQKYLETKEPANTDIFVRELAKAISSGTITSASSKSMSTDSSGIVSGSSLSSGLINSMNTMKMESKRKNPFGLKVNTNLAVRPENYSDYVYKKGRPYKLDDLFDNRRSQNTLKKQYRPAEEPTRKQPDRKVKKK